MASDSLTYRFGRFRLEESGHALFRDDSRVPLTRKAFATLRVLLEHAGKTVPKRQLMDRVWPDTVVGEATLAQNVYTIRRALEAGGCGEAIETEAGVGYRFATPVECEPTPLRPDPSPPRARGLSAAVLPFRPLAPNPTHRHLGVCLADALITRLSRIRDLTVRPSSAIFPYVDRDVEIDPLQAGRDLHVDAVLVGTLVVSEGRLRANVQLVDVSANAPLWADRFDVPFTDILTAEDEITEQVVGTLALSLELDSPDGPSRGRRPIPADEEAYRAYVRGRYFWNKRTQDGLDRAVESFRYALTIDPEYAQARAGLADCFALYPIYADAPPRESLTRAKKEAVRALELDPGLPEPHASLAYARFLLDWDWEGSEAGFRRALRVDPKYATAHHWYATLLSARGRPEEAIASVRRALDLDPLSLVINADLALIHYFSGHPEEAVRQGRRTLELDARFGYGHFVLALALCETGRADEAVAAGRAATAASGRSTAAVSLLGYTLAVTGHPDEARGLLAELDARSRTAYVPAARSALIATGLGDRDVAVARWRAAIEERSRFAAFLGVWPLLEGLRQDPGFRELVSGIGGS